MRPLSAELPSVDGRVIIHLDLDAFYAQVESRRLGIDPTTPLVVQQWRGIIAVNYAARAAGIKRHLTVDEAAKLCPGVVFVHVETIGGDEDEADDDAANANASLDFFGEKATAASARAADATRERVEDDGESAALRRATTYRPSDAGHGASSVGPPDARKPLADPPDRERRKVSLARYRRASFAVMETLADAFPDGAVERASVDEAYVDVTNEVDAILGFGKTRPIPRSGLRGVRQVGGDEGEDAIGAERDVSARVARGLDASGFVRPLRPEASVSDRRLALGADACRRARAAVLARTGFTMSGGIAHNKMLAKLASARNKPNKQTVVSRVAAGEMLEGLPMRSIKGLGGKLGERVERALIERMSSRDDVRVGVGSSASRTAAERVARSGNGRGSSYEGGFTAASLRLLFSASSQTSSAPWSPHLDDKTAAWLERTSRGEDTDPVVANVRDGAKSVTAFKSFKAVRDVDKAHGWLKVLSHELAERLAEDRRRLRRAPRSARLEYRAEPNPNANPPRAAFETRSKTFAFPADATAALAAGDARRAGEALTRAAAKIFTALGPEATMPCTRVGLATSDFAPTPTEGVGIQRFFGESAKRADARRASEGSELETFFRDDDAETVDASVRAILAGSSDAVGAAASAAVRADGPNEPERRTTSAFQTAQTKKESFSMEKEKAGETSPAARSAPVSALDSSASLVACPRCGLRTAPGRDAQSHADEHLAFDLAKSEPQHRAGAPRDRSRGVGVGSKRRTTGAAAGVKRGRGERGGAASRDAAGTASVSSFFAKR